MPHTCQNILQHEKKYFIHLIPLWLNLMDTISNFIENKFCNKLVLNHSFNQISSLFNCYLSLEAIKPIAKLPNIKSMGPTTAEDDWDKSERKRKKSRLKKNAG